MRPDPRSDDEAGTGLHLKCPRCSVFSTFIIGSQQAMCLTEDCEVLMFDPSVPDGGLSSVQVVDIPQEWIDLTEPEPDPDDVNAGFEMYGPPGMVDRISTDLTRTQGGTVVHRTTCSTLVETRGLAPWLWAQGRDPDEVRRAAAMVGSRPCCICHPFNPAEGTT